MTRPVSVLVLLAGLTLFNSPLAGAEVHRATWLGNPATRFAPPLRTPEDLRARFRDEQLKPDIASVLRQWRWKGNPEDLHRAALTNEIREWNIPVGATMPFMSTRRNGHPICLFNVIWAGKEPASAYAFEFTSREHRYRCVTPKACSNFFLEDLGPEPKPALALDCVVPAQVPVGRPAEICLNLRNTGDAPEPRVTVTMPVGGGAVATDAKDGAVDAEGRVMWTISNLEPNTTRKLCATVVSRQLGPLPFAATASGTRTKPAQAACATTIIGIPAILLEVVDLDDPIEVGKEITYEIKVTNQGSANGTNIRVVCALDASQEFVSSSGDTPATAQDGTITMDPLPALDPKAAAFWKVVVKAAKAEDARFKVELRSDQIDRPVTEDESTRQY
jgi:uncharacterized repeat protein (TIGR01451 family)